MFVFYDTETTGTIHEFDQILQFAAILTDDDLNEIDRINVRCRRLPWVVPAPMALWITGVHASQLDDPAYPSFYEMMSGVRKKLEAWPAAIFIGYNSVKFDEPFLQRAFWQTLHPPYLTVMNGNARMDLFPLVQAASHLSDGALNYPTTDKGRRGFKLDQLAPLNGFSHDNAHDAISDVEATIHVAKRVKKGARTLWDHAVLHAPKRATSSILELDKPVLVAEHYSAPSVWWGQRIDSDGAKASKAKLLRLDQDWRALAGLDDEALAKKLFASPKPLRDIGLNKAPIVYSLDQAKEFWGLSPSADELEQSNLLLSDRDIALRVRDVYETAGKDWPEGEHLEQKIFQGFPDHSDKRLMEKFHTADWVSRAQMVRQFQDVRLQQLAQRLVYMDAPHLLALEERARIATSIAERIWSDHENKNLWRTLSAAQADLKNVLSRDEDGRQAEEIKTWLEELSKRYPIS